MSPRTASVCLRISYRHFGNMEERADKIADEEFNRLGEQPANEDFDGDMSDIAEQATAHGQAFFDTMVASSRPRSICSLLDCFISWSSNLPRSATIGPLRFWCLRWTILTLTWLPIGMSVILVSAFDSSGRGQKSSN